MIRAKKAVVQQLVEYILVCPYCGDIRIEEDVDDLLYNDKCRACGKKMSVEYRTMPPGVDK